MHIVDAYLNEKLIPRLKGYGLNKAERQTVSQDVETRLSSLLGHWKNAPFRDTALMLGQEEAFFWEPAEASLERRALVVVGVRNSAVESLNYGGGKRPVVPDEEMPALTTEAVEFFTDEALASAAPVSNPNKDLFGTISRQYPNAGHGLYALSRAPTGESPYQLTLRKAKELDLSKARTTTPQHAVVTHDGMAPDIEPVLGALMRAVEARRMNAFVSVSFSRITRNPAKMLAVLDHLLRNRAALVLHNYMLTATEVCVREQLLRPAHDNFEADLNQRNLEGLCARHREALLAAG